MTISYHLILPTRSTRGISRWEVNFGAVRGKMTTGGGHTNLCNTVGAMGVPVMAKGNFIRTEASIGEWWREKLNESLIEAAL